MQRQERKHRQSPDLNQTKVTPRTRPTHEAHFDGSLINPDPTKKYVLAPTDEQHPMNWQYYESIGYKVENAEKDGVRIRLGTAPQIGKPLQWRGNVLLSCSQERGDQIFLEGPLGNTGQKYYDKLMAKARNNDLDKRSPVAGLKETIDISELEQNAAPGMRE